MKLPARYKGNRRRREAPIVASCVCGWQSRPCARRKAVQHYQAHIAIHTRGHSGRTFIQFDAMAEQTNDWRGFLETVLSDASNYMRVEYPMRREQP